MPLVSVTLPADGDSAVVAPYNTAITAILGAVNGHIDTNNIADASVTVGKFAPGAVQAALNIGTVPADWTTLATVPSVASSNGQKSYTFTYPAVDYTDRLQVGTKLRIPRSVTAPTQSFSFSSGGSQYASKTSPSGFVFTDNFTCEAWIYITNYLNDMVIESRFDGSNGFRFRTVSTTGQILMEGFNAGNARQVLSYQSVPLNQWVHIAATFNLGGNLGHIYMYGADVPTAISGSPTSIVQGGSLQIGAANSTTFFNGQIADPRIWNVVRTQQQINDNMSKQLVGNETNLVSYYKTYGAWTDSTTNANTLTASGGALNNYAANPFNAIEFGVVVSPPSFSTNTTVIIYTGNKYSVPNETLGSTSYSSVATPFGFSRVKQDWSIETLLRSQTSTVINTTTAPLTGAQLIIPIGRWTMSLRGYILATSSARAFLNTTVGISSVTNSFTQDKLLGAPNGSSVSAAEVDGYINLTGGDTTLISQTTHYLVSKTGGNDTIYYGASQSGITIMLAECPYI